MRRLLTRKMLTYTAHLMLLSGTGFDPVFMICNALTVLHFFRCGNLVNALNSSSLCFLVGHSSRVGSVKYLILFILVRVRNSSFSVS